MAKEYSFGGDGLTILSAPVTLAFIHAAASVSPSLYLMRLWASQSASATSAQQRIEAVSQPTAFPTLVSTGATPRSLKQSDTVASIITPATTGAAGTCGINASAEGAGVKVVMFGDNFNVLNGYLWVPTPREVIELAPGHASGFGLYLSATPATTGGWAVGINYAEGA